MSQISPSQPGHKHAAFIRLAGIVSLLAILIHFLVNMALKEFPPANASLQQLREYFNREAATWAVVHGLRYVAIAGIVFMLSGLFVRTRSMSEDAHRGWQLIGLLGGTIWLANLTITNGIEMFAFLDFALLAEMPELFWLLFYLTRVLFAAEIVAWAIVIFGFSMAGRSDRTLPNWVTFPGFAISAIGFAASLFVVNCLNEGPACVLDTIAGIGSLLWFVAASGFLAARANR